MADGIMADPFTSVLCQPDLFEKLATFQEVRKHLADPGFTEKIKELRALASDPALDRSDITKMAAVGQRVAQAGHKDPRILQALMALQGQGLIVDEKDIKRAEEQGDMKRREPVQLEQMQMVKDISDPEQARVKGNEHFKAGDFSAALAHYDRGVALLRSQEQVPAAPLATLLSNAALCLLKLKWPDRAKRNASAAIAVIRQAEDATFDQSKLFYRRALASEQLKDFEMAVGDMSRALQQATLANLGAPEMARLNKELARLTKLKESASAQTDRKKQEHANEREAEVQRLQGAKLEEARRAGSGVPNPLNPGGDYLAESDWTHWTQRRVAEAVRGIQHVGQSGAKLETIELMEDKSKIQASITTKRGVRALYYEMDVSVSWKGKAAKQLRPSDGADELQGLIRVYNIAHDTKFQLGGDENTSYIYQLGWDQRLKGDWVEDLSTEAAELFDLVAQRVDGVIQDLQKK